MSSSGRASRRHRVIRSSSAQSMPSAMLASAQAETATPEPGENPLEAVRRAGFEEGRRAALDELAGLEEASRSAAGERLAIAAATAAEQRQRVVEQVTGDVVDLVVDLLATLVDHEVSLSGLPEREALRRAMRFAPSGSDLVVRVHPGAPLSARDVELMANGANVTVREDASVEPGACVVEIGSCRIDAQIGPALVRVRQALDALRGGDKAVSA